MAKSKKPTMKELSQGLYMVDGGLREIIFAFQAYLEMKGDLLEFNQHMAERKRKHDEKMKEKDGNTD
tara:strand:+ start:618 stop:818 length:201 start_codon:yes stop_codon:yes gene_type:complete